MKRTMPVVAAVAALLAGGLTADGPARAAIIRASAGLGGEDYPAAGMGQDAGPVFYLGYRFTLDNVAQVEQVGGRMSGMWGTLFAAIVPLSGPAGLPSSPFDDTTALASAVFSPPPSGEPSVDLRIPMSVTLNPGSYALIFGSGHFGAYGRGTMPAQNPPLVNGDSYIFYSNWWTGGWNWSSEPNGLPRFVVEGVVIPEPSGGILAAVAMSFLGFSPHRARSLARAAKGAIS